MTSMIFTVMCFIVALFCILALGLGPFFFAIVGALAFVAGFRVRRQRWWGLALGGGGLALSLGALAGWRFKTVVLAVIITFLLVVVLRFAGRSVVSTSADR